MKLLFLLAVGFALFPALEGPLRGTEPASPAEADGVRLTILTVNMKKIFESHPMTIDAERKISERRNSTGRREAAEIPGIDKSKALVEEMKKLDADLAGGKLEGEAHAQALRARSEMMRLLKELDEEVRRFQQTREKALQADSARMRDEIVADIMRAIAATPELKGASLVLDSSGALLDGVPVVVWGDPKLDRTEAVRRQIGASNGANSTKAGGAAPDRK